MLRVTVYTHDEVNKMPSQALSEARQALQRVRLSIAHSTHEFWQQMVNKFRNMTPEEREEMYAQIELYAHTLTAGHSAIVTAALRHLREIYRGITGRS